MNDDYGALGHTNLGAKLYLLVADTDIDLMWAGKGSRPERFGFDFSRNLGTQLEVHGEWARAIGVTRRELGADGSVSTTTANADSWLIGARYLSENEVTVIGELYRNGLGFDEDQLARFYALLDQAFAAGGGQALQALARSLAQAGYGRANPGRNYAYLRVSAKDPFDWLYVSPSLTSIVNLDDQSYQLTLRAALHRLGERRAAAARHPDARRRSHRVRREAERAARGAAAAVVLLIAETAWPAGSSQRLAPQCRITVSCRWPSSRTNNSVNSASSR